jgi:hypothetical protein
MAGHDLLIILSKQFSEIYFEKSKQFDRFVIPKGKAVPNSNSNTPDSMYLELTAERVAKATNKVKKAFIIIRG